MGSARVSIPSGWEQVRLGEHPNRCVILARRVVYLGRQGATARCPAHRVGVTRAIQIEPLRSSFEQGVRFEKRPVRIAGMRVWRSAAPRASGRLTVVVPSLRVALTLPYGTNRRLSERVLKSIRGSGHQPPAGKVEAPSTAPRAKKPAQGRRSRAAVFAGGGFDACSAPTAETMSAWLQSPYRAVGVYIGGVNRGCAQPNLTPAWVTTVQGQGWHLIPTYVGLQAPCADPGYGQKIDPAQAGAQGGQAADDAINQGGALGLAADPIYLDMEQFPTSDPACVDAVKNFLQGWTNELHAKGWTAGVYGSASSTGKVLSDAIGSGYTEPDDLWYANWDGRPVTSGDPYVPDGAFAGHQRIHQYQGGHNESYGGATLNIDNDQVDGAVADPIPPYGYQLASVAAFSGPRLKHATDLGQAHLGEDAWVVVKAVNTGTETWQRGGDHPVRLGTWAPQDRTSAFSTSDWLNPNRAAGLVEESVAPGKTGTFVAHLRIPAGSSASDEHFNLVAEGATWMADQGILVHVQVLPYAWKLVSHKAFTGTGLKHRINLRRLHPGQSAYVLIRARNVGTGVWQPGGANPVRLGTWGPQDRSSPFRAKDWLTPNRPVGVRRAVAPGKTARLRLHLRAPRKRGRYTERFNLVAEGAAWMPAQHLVLRPRVIRARSHR